MVPEGSAYPLFLQDLLLSGQNFLFFSLRISGILRSVHIRLLPAYRLPLSYIQNVNIHICGHILTEVRHTVCQNDVRKGCPVRMHIRSHVPSLS